MADYKELIRKAIQALPENNGAARRAVYEKARAALVGQLRGLDPPLAARDITQHRLQLEDCIRQVEQEASEAVIAGLKQNEDLAMPRQPALPPPRPILAGPRPSSGPSRTPIAANSVRPAVPPPVPRAGSAAGQRPNGAAGTAHVAPPAATIASVQRPVAAKSASAAPAVPRLATMQPKNGSAVAAVMPAPRPANSQRPAPAVRPQGASYPRAVVQPQPEADPEDHDGPETIEDIIAAAEGSLAEPMEMEDGQASAIEVHPESERQVLRAEARPQRRVDPPVAPRPEGRAVPAIVARAEAVKSGRPGARPQEAPRRVNGEGQRSPAPQPDRGRPGSRPQASEPIQLPRAAGGNAAMSSVREVELENPSEHDPQVAIERAIATLEREARNDGEDVAALDTGVSAERPSGPGRRRNGREQADREQPLLADPGFARAPVERERGGGSAITIFLLVFLALLVVVGGVGLWAWREGFIDFDAMFGKSQPAVEQTSSATAPATTAQMADSSKPAAGTSQTAPTTNTEPAPSTPAQSSAPLSAAPSTPAAAPATPAASAEPSAQTGDAPKSEERLTTSSDDGAAALAAPDLSKPATDGAVPAANGSQSLLLEASQDGTQGAVPFSGTVEWSRGTDELGQPTLIGKATIPARNLGVSVLIRKNSDPTLPASHLMEINFTVNDSFIGGSIAGLPGVLLKNEELVQGTPLVGASARVVGNSFLFALSSSAADEATNRDLLTTRKWMDLAIIYATGKKAIITLEKDDKAEKLFTDVFDAWAKETPTPAAAPAAATPATPPKAN